MEHGKDFSRDKPGITTLEQLAAVRKTIAQTKRIYAIMYSERLEVRAAVKAGELIQSGAIGQVIQTINIAPHQVSAGHGDAGGGSGRPEWFWDPDLYGGILCDIGSHQVDQFLYYTGSTEAEVVAAQIANVAHPDQPRFQDFGDMMLRGNRGMGYVRLDWFTPDGLGTWGDGRLFVLGTQGYIELRKYTMSAVAKQGNNLFIVDQKQARYMDCSNLTLAVRSAVRCGCCESHAHGAGPDAVSAGGGAVHQGAAECDGGPTGALTRLLFGSCAKPIDCRWRGKHFYYLGAGRGGRTPTTLRSADFESVFGLLQSFAIRRSASRKQLIHKAYMGLINVAMLRSQTQESWKPTATKTATRAFGGFLADFNSH